MWKPFSKAGEAARRAAEATKRIFRRKPAKPAPSVPGPPPGQTPPSEPPPGITPTGQDRLRSVLEAVRATGVPVTYTEDGESSHSDDRIADLVEDVGRPNATRLLRRQLESCNAYRQGSVQPGRDRWYSREETLESMFKGTHQLMSSYEPYFYYHIKK